MLNDLPDALNYVLEKDNFYSMEFSPNIGDFKDLEKACFVLHRQQYKRINHFTPLTKTVLADYDKIYYLFTSRNSTVVKRMQHWMKHYNFELFVWDGYAVRLYPDWVTRLNELEYFVKELRPNYMNT